MPVEGEGHVKGASVIWTCKQLFPVGHSLWGHSLSCIFYSANFHRAFATIQKAALHC